MKLEENMYIRTDEGIRKILKEYDEGYELDRSLHYLYPEGHDLYKEDIDDEEILKASFNIIDLIEVGDYVNGKEVKHIAYFEGVEEDIPKLIFVDEHRLVPGEICENDEIKSIVTKEQFEVMKYEVR